MRQCVYARLNRAFVQRRLCVALLGGGHLLVCVARHGVDRTDECAGRRRCLCDPPATGSTERRGAPSTARICFAISPTRTPLSCWANLIPAPNTISGRCTRWRLCAARTDNMVIGFESFPRRVQPVLDDWSAGKLSADQFLKSRRVAHGLGIRCGALYAALSIRPPQPHSDDPRSMSRDARIARWPRRMGGRAGGCARRVE